MILEVRDIGQYELGSDLLLSGFNIGMTKASFSLTGIIPVSSDPDQSILSGVVNSLAHSLRSEHGTPSGPQDDELGSFLIALYMS